VPGERDHGRHSAGAGIRPAAGAGGGIVAGMTQRENTLVNKRLTKK